MAEGRVTADGRRVRVTGAGRRANRCAVCNRNVGARSGVRAGQRLRRRMDTNFYDVIVCGAELAGLVSAALLARRGLRVLLLGPRQRSTELRRRRHSRCRARRRCCPRWSRNRSRACSPSSTRVQVIRRRAPIMSPGYQVALPRRRFDLLAEREPARRELGARVPRRDRRDRGGDRPPGGDQRPAGCAARLGADAAARRILGAARGGAPGIAAAAAGHGSAVAAARRPPDARGVRGSRRDVDGAVARRRRHRRRGARVRSGAARAAPARGRLRRPVRAAAGAAGDVLRRAAREGRAGRDRA